MAARKDENIHQSAKENTTDTTNYLNMDSIDDKPVLYSQKSGRRPSTHSRPRRRLVGAGCDVITTEKIGLTDILTK